MGLRLIIIKICDRFHITLLIELHCFVPIVYHWEWGLPTPQCATAASLGPWALRGAWGSGGRLHRNGPPPPPWGRECPRGLGGRHGLGEGVRDKHVV